jgi:archaemetzincin
MEKHKIIIEPFSEIEASILEELRNHLGEVFSLEVEILPVKMNFDFAFFKERNQYLASTILERLKDFKKNFLEKWLAVVDVDLFAKNLNFVFGEADLDYGICIISLSRLRQGFYGLPEDENLFLERIKKEATHELGHLFYLGHCKNPKCVMYFSNSLLDTDKKGAIFCSECQKNLRSYLEKK